MLLFRKGGGDMRQRKLTVFLMLFLALTLLIQTGAGAEAPAVPGDALPTGTANRFNVELVLDASVSMNESDARALRFEAIRLFNNLLPNEGNSLGGVVFSTDVDREIGPQPVNGPEEKDAVVRAIRDVPLPGGWTNIGAGLDRALDRLKENGNPELPSVIILLSVVLGKTLNVENTIFEKIGANIISMFIVFGLLYWVSMARLIRGQILSLREQEYVLSAQATGAKGSWIIRKHLLPNCISVIIISTALQIPNAIFTESFLSFLGLGVNAPMPSLGSLASDALNGITSYTYRLVIPAIVICLIVLSLNLFGDGLRDAFDPKLNA